MRIQCSGHHMRWSVIRGVSRSRKSVPAQNCDAGVIHEAIVRMNIWRREVAMRKRIQSLFFAAACALQANPSPAQGTIPGAQATSQELPASPAPTPPASPPRTINDILQVLDSYKPDPGVNDRAKKMAAQERPETNDPKALGAFYYRRSDAWSVLGSKRKQVADLREAVRVTERKNPFLVDMLATQEYNIGRPLSAIELREELLKLGGGWEGTSSAGLAWFVALVGDFDRAKRYLDVAERNFVISRQKSLRSGKEDLWLYDQKSGLARGKHYFFLAQGKYAEAEAAAREAVFADEKDAEIRPRRRLLGTSDVRNDGYFLGVFANDEIRLAHVLVLQGKLAEAESWARNSLRHHLENHERFVDGTARSLTTLSQLLAEQARFAEADAVAKRAVDTFVQSGSESNSVYLNEGRLARADALVAQGSWGEAVEEYVRRRDGLAGDPEFSQRVGVEEPGWAIALIRSGKPQEAKAMLEVIEKRMVERVGAEHYDVAEVRGLLGIALVELGDKRGAVARFRKATERLLARNAGSDQARSPARALRLNMILEAYIGLLHDIQGSALESETRIDAAGEAFALADAARGQSTQRAIAASAAC